MDRETLLELKRAKLEELKKQRLEREREYKKLDVEELSSNSLVDSIVHDVLGEEKGKEESEARINPIEAVTTKKDDEVTSEVKQEVTDNINPSVMMYSKAVDAEEDHEDSPVKPHGDDSQSRVLAQMKASIENELQTKYTKELEHRLHELTLSQENTLKKSNEAIMQIFETPKDPLARNTERMSKYARSLTADSSTEKLLEEDGFTSSSASFVSAIITLDIGLGKPMAIGALDWSPHYPELILACYNASNGINPGSQGIIVVWNTTTRKPEFTLLSYAELTIARFAKRKANQVIAGGKDGKLYLWQFDSSSRYPIAYSASSSSEMGISPVVGIYETSNSVVSISSKGLVSIYSLNLVNRINEETIKIPGLESYVVTSCYMDSTQLALGLATGEVYVRRTQQIDEIQALRGPTDSKLPITCLDYANGIVVAGSVDYALKVLDTSGKENREIFVPYLIAEIQFRTGSDQFITESFDGRLELWDIERERSRAVESIQLTGSDTLNRVKWSIDGQSLACGGLSGKVYVISIK